MVVAPSWWISICKNYRKGRAGIIELLIWGGIKIHMSGHFEGISPSKSIVWVGNIMTPEIGHIWFERLSHWEAQCPYMYS